MQKKEQPTRPVKPDDETPTVRERTLTHLDALMRATTTMLGTGVLLASGAQDKNRPLVVDPPPPPPPECCEHPDQFLVRGCIRVAGAWEKADRQWVLHVVLDAAARTPVGFEGLAKSDLKLSGIALKKLQAKPKQVDVVLAPVGDEKSPSLQLPVTCKGKKLPLKLALDLSGPKAEDRSIPVKLIN